MRNLASIDPTFHETCYKSTKTIIKPITNTEQLMNTFKSGKLAVETSNKAAVAKDSAKLKINTDAQDMVLNRSASRSPPKGRTPGSMSATASKANMSLVDTFKRRIRCLNTLKGANSPSEPASPARSRDGSDIRSR